MEQIRFLAGRSALDIEGLGEKTSGKLVEAGLVSGIAEIFRLVGRKDELTSLEGFAEISVDNLVSEIEHAKTKPLSRWITALGIPQVGAAAAQDLAQKFGSFESLAGAELGDVLSIYGFGEIMAKSVVEYFSDERNAAMLAELSELGVKSAPPEHFERAGSAGPFFGKTIVITGTIPDATREELKTFLEYNGAKMSDSVSKKTSLLIAGENAGSKLDKAKKLKVQVASPADFEKMISSAGSGVSVPTELANHIYFSRFEKSTS